MGARTFINMIQHQYALSAVAGRQLLDENRDRSSDFFGDFFGVLQTMRCTVGLGPRQPLLANFVALYGSRRDRRCTSKALEAP